MPFCLWCGGKLGKNATICCSRQCSSIYKLHININKWKLGIDDGVKGINQVKVFIRVYLFNKYNNKCQKCSWGLIHPNTGLVPLAIHHKDGNCLNNKEDNLELLCPNCHCMTDNYGSLNTDNIIKRKLSYR